MLRMGNRRKNKINIFFLFCNTLSEHNTHRSNCNNFLDRLTLMCFTAAAFDFTQLTRLYNDVLNKQVWYELIDNLKVVFNLKKKLAVFSIGNLMLAIFILENNNHKIALILPFLKGGLPVFALKIPEILRIWFKF